MLSTGGMVVTLKFSSLKHKVPSNLSVVLEMYTANPRKSGVNLLVEPEMEFTMKSYSCFRYMGFCQNYLTLYCVDSGVDLIPNLRCFQKHI